MHNIPQHPQTLITHQLECIRCKHIFPVAEDSPARRRSRSAGQWTALVQWHPDEHRRNLYQHPEVHPPGPHVDPYLVEHEPGHESHYLSDKTMHVFCPRCGADNRNWLYLTRNKQVEMIRGSKKYIALASLLFFALALLIGAVIDFPADRRLRSAIFWAGLILAWLLPLLMVPGQWKAVREHRYFVQIAAHLSFWDKISPAVKTAVSLMALFVFIIPVGLYLIMPILADISENVFIVDPQQEAIAELDVLTRKLPAHLAQNQQEVRTIVSALNSMQMQLGVDTTTPLPNPEQVILQTTDWALQVLDGARAQVSTMSNQELAQLRSNLEPAYNAVQGIEATQTAENVDFLFNWFRFVGLTSLVSSIFAVLAASHLDREYDKHLPRPIYHSLSDMTRVAKWEVNKALSTRESVIWVQWTNVVRNGIGGLILTGYLRDRPATPNAETVRAQKYTVETDRWCRITNAEIVDLQTPPPPQGNSSEWVRSVQRVERNSAQGGGNPPLAGGNGRQEGSSNTPQLPANHTSKIYISLS